jgi:hypothetical protein
MVRQPFLYALAIAVAFLAGSALSKWPASATAQSGASIPVVGHGKCVGVAAVLRTPSVFIYRAFEDGTVEATLDDSGQLAGKWQSIGQ